MDAICCITTPHLSSSYRVLIIECHVMQVIDNIDSYLASCDHFRFTWFPHTDRCALYDISRTTTVAYTNASSTFFYIFENEEGLANIC